MAGPKTFEKVKIKLFKKLPNGQFIAELHKFDKNNEYEKEINILKFINK